jgi:hypothetical protein
MCEFWRSVTILHSAHVVRIHGIIELMELRPIRVPVFITRTAYDAYVTVPPNVTGATCGLVNVDY